MDDEHEYQAFVQCLTELANGNFERLKEQRAAALAGECLQVRLLLLRKFEQAATKAWHAGRILHKQWTELMA